MSPRRLLPLVLIALAPLAAGAQDEDVVAVTFHVEGAAYPNYIGTAQRRLVLLEGDRLTLRTPPEPAGDSAVTYDIVWERER